MEQMKIEILEPYKMVQKGSALYRLLMNDHTPVLDLFVRESIQNSLDAAASKDNMSIPVDVHYRVGKFDSSRLNKCLEGVEDKLNQRFPVGGDSYKYISISDSGTQGLTGPMRLEDVVGDNSGNLINLVYDICKPQNDASAGGSWGIGKTIYFRIGIGLVVYYSRILNSQTKKYESRLAAGLVENESSNDAIIPQYKNNLKYGIAWWGQMIDQNKTMPITDEDYIKDFLSIFDISEYTGNQTGTTIIIPYINEKRLLNNNAITWNGQNGFIPNWMNSIEEYLRIAVQRWYFPRLDNKRNKSFKRLEVQINGRPVDYDSFLPLFKLEQSLYNKASGLNVDNDYLPKTDVKTDGVRLKSVLEEPLSGNLSYVKVKKEMVGMCPPDNDYHPNVNFNIQINDPTKNDPVVAYCRKPGMIVAYDQESWVRNVPPCSSDEFILAVYVLNSNNKLASSDMSLEEYIRKGEHADHSSWNDSSVDGKNPTIVQRIQNNVSRNLVSAFSDVDDNSPRKNSGLGKFLGDMILPPIGFGTQSTNRPRRDSSGGSTSRSSVRYKLENVDYNGDVMSISYKVSSEFEAKELGLETLISSESTSISFDIWEQELGLDLPFRIISHSIKINKIDKEKCYNTYLIKDTDKETDELLEIRRNKTTKGSCYGMSVVFHEKHTFDASITIKMLLYKRDVRPVIKPL